MTRALLMPILSAVLLVAIWTGFAEFLQSRYLPTPASVVIAFTDELVSGALLHHLIVTILRVLSAFSIAITIGTAIGIGLGRNSTADRFFDPWLILALNIPALVIIVFCYLWIGINEVAAISAVALNKIPNTAVTIREGAKALDTNLDDIAKLYRYSGFRKFKHFIWPQIEPYFAASVRSGLALIWKIVLIVELLGRSNGVGFQINFFFSQFDLTRILVYAFSFMAIVMLIESSIIKPWEKRARRWRGEAL